MPQHFAKQASICLVYGFEALEIQNVDHFMLVHVHPYTLSNRWDGAVNVQERSNLFR